MPKWGLSIHEAKILKWNFSTNDFVKEGQELCEIETDKATLPLISESAGRLKILLQKGETAGIGDVACSIDTDAKQP